MASKRAQNVAAAQTAGLGLAEQLGAERAGFEDRAAATAQATGIADARMASRAGTGIDEDPMVRAQQADLARMLQDRAAGRVPSIANIQARQGAQDAARAGLALAATGRGNVGEALGRAQQAAGQAATAAAGQGMIGRLQEQQMAEQGLGGVLSGMRGQDIQRGGMEADIASRLALQDAALQTQVGLERGRLGTQTSLANLDAATRQRMMDDAMRQSLLQGQTAGLGNVMGVTTPGRKPGSSAFDWFSAAAGPAAAIATG